MGRPRFNFSNDADAESRSGPRNNCTPFSLIAILTNALAGGVNLQITKAINKLTVRSKISRGDLARVIILAAQQPAASRKTFELLASEGAAPPDEQLVEQLERIPAGS